MMVVLTNVVATGDGEKKPGDFHTFLITYWDLVRIDVEGNVKKKKMCQKFLVSYMGKCINLGAFN